jgi:hypothetical protein
MGQKLKRIGAIGLAAGILAAIALPFVWSLVANVPAADDNASSCGCGEHLVRETREAPSRYVYLCVAAEGARRWLPYPPPQEVFPSGFRAFVCDVGMVELAFLGIGAVGFLTLTIGGLASLLPPSPR